MAVPKGRVLEAIAKRLASVETELDQANAANRLAQEQWQGAKRLSDRVIEAAKRRGWLHRNGRFVALEPDPSHPTGKALCAKGRAAPELVYHPDRLTHPLRRTRPKGDADPGWERIG